MAKLYAEPTCCDKGKFEMMKDIVLKKEPKVMSTAIEQMREELAKINIPLE